MTCYIRHIVAAQCGNRCLRHVQKVLILWSMDYMDALDVFRIHPLGVTNACTQLYINPCSSYGEKSVRICGGLTDAHPDHD